MDKLELLYIMLEKTNSVTESIRDNLLDFFIYANNKSDSMKSFESLVSNEEGRQLCNAFREMTDGSVC